MVHLDLRSRAYEPQRVEQARIPDRDLRSLGALDGRARSELGCAQTNPFMSKGREGYILQG